MRRLLWLAAIGVLLASAGTKSRDDDTDCDPSYPTLCIPVGAADLDCAEVAESDFPVRPPDPHHFDADHDGRGCEPWPRRARR